MQRKCVMIAVLTDPTAGGTFLTWTLYYLSGRTDYYSWRQNKKITVIDNPIGSMNAHKFLPNQLNSVDNVNDSNFINFLKNHPEDIVYFHYLKGCDGTVIDILAKECKKIIQLSVARKNSLYYCTYNKRYIPGNISQSEHHQNFILNYFGESNKKWNYLNMTNNWDRREFLALSIRPTDFPRITDMHDFNFDHYCLDVYDLWTMFDQTVTKLFDYLNLPIDTTRWDQWVNVYREWKGIHYQVVQFDLYFDKIINYILTGKNFNLLPFNLDIYQEAAIQHTLIYKHNLNLKTFQLEQFQSTQQLHNLLEPNTHTQLPDNT